MKLSIRFVRSPNHLLGTEEQQIEVGVCESAEGEKVMGDLFDALPVPKIGRFIGVPIPQARYYKNQIV